MNQAIKNLTSLDNLKKGNLAGQMATFLILIITVMLIFVLTLVNVGQVSNYATNLANAADSASLYLASQLGTEAYQLSVSLYESCKNGKKCCKSSGFLGIIVAIVVAIVSILTAQPEGIVAAVAIAASTAAVAAGVVGTIDGTGFLQGAIQGAMVGAAIGGGYALFIPGAAGGAGAGGALGGATGAATGAPTIATAGAMASGAGTAGAVGGSATAATTAGIGTIGAAGAMGSGAGTAGAVGSGWSAAAGAMASGAGTFGAIGGSAISAGSIAGMGLASGLAAANAYIKMEMQADAMAAAAKALNGLPKKKRIRESVFLRAFSETIDDPNKVADTEDIDGDGDTEEKIPVFQILWDRRTEEIRTASANMTKQANKAIDYFFENPAKNFQSALDIFKGELSRLEIEGGDGIVTELLRALEAAGYDISFWVPGPSATELDPIKNWEPPEDCEACEPPDPPPTFDELDSTVDYLQGVTEMINNLKEAATADTWEQWGSLLYDDEVNPSVPDPEEGEEDYFDPNDRNASLYDTLGSLIDANPPLGQDYKGLNGWIMETENVRDRIIPDCLYDLTTGTFTNPPCQGDPNNPSNPDFATIDPDIEDEFQPVLDAVRNFIPAAEQFRQDCRNFATEMAGLIPPEPDDDEEDAGPAPEPASAPYGLSGDNPVTYKWQDSRGDHWITVQTNKFKMPKIKKTSSLFKVCLKLKRYKKRVKVKISRTDPSGQVGVGGLLGRWNPSGGTIERVSVARYRAVKYKTLEKEAEKNYVRVDRRTWDK